MSDDEDLTPTTTDDMIKLMGIFDRCDSPIKDKIYKFGAGQGYSDHQIDGMIENLLDYGYIHEPIRGHFKMLRKIE